MARDSGGLRSGPLAVVLSCRPGQPLSTRSPRPSKSIPGPLSAAPDLADATLAEIVALLKPQSKKKQTKTVRRKREAESRARELGAETLQDRDTKEEGSRLKGSISGT